MAESTNQARRAASTLCALYWQAMTLLEMLLRSEPYKARLPVLFKALQDANSTNLEPHLVSILNTNWDDLTSDWQEFCRAQSIAKPPDAK